MSIHVRDTVQCLSCGALYERPGHNEDPYFHVCHPDTDNPRNEHKRYSDIDGYSSHAIGAPDPIQAEGKGVKVLHQGERTPEELDPAGVNQVQPLRAKRTRKPKVEKHAGTHTRKARR